MLCVFSNLCIQPIKILVHLCLLRIEGGIGCTFGLLCWVGLPYYLSSDAQCFRLLLQNLKLCDCDYTTTINEVNYTFLKPERLTILNWCFRSGLT